MQYNQYIQTDNTTEGRKKYNMDTEGTAENLAHANCSPICASNAQRRTGSQQGDKTIFFNL